MKPADMLRLAVTFALALAATGVALHPSQEADVFFHVELGRAVLEHGARVVPEPLAMSDFEPTCVVPAWLWDVIAYGVHAAGGFTALSLLNLAFAFVGAWLVARMTRVWMPAPAATSGDGFVAWLVVTALTLICVSTRFALRPQTLAFAVLAGFMLLLHGYPTALPSVQRKRGAGLLVLAALWAQLHGSFVLAPVLFAIVIVGAWLEGHAAALRDKPRRALLTQLGLLVTLFSSASGLGVAAYIGEHGYGDAVKLIAEMAPPTWVQLVSLQGAYGKALVVLWLLSLVGLTQQARFQWTSIGLACFGHLLLSRAHRFVAEDAILCAPLAVSGALNVAAWAAQAMQPVWRRACTTVLVLALTGLFARHVVESLRGDGGRFGLGIEETAFPRLSATYLQRMPEGTRVLSDFTSGPPLGLWTFGKLRTYVDGRTPMYFDDTDYAVAREVFSDPAALDRALRRWAPGAAVIERAHGGCDLLARRWHAVVIEARYTTFVPPHVAPALRGIDPCGPEYVHADRVRWDELDESVARLSRLGRSRFLELLRADRLLFGPAPDAREALRALDASASTVYIGYLRRARIHALARMGQLDDAYATMLDALEDGDVGVMALMALPQLGALDLRRARTLVELAVERLGEATPPATRSMLAALCVHENDAPCVRFHALRAAARGAPNVEPSLQWLVEHARTERMRKDARVWLELLQKEREAPAKTGPHAP